MKWKFYICTNLLFLVALLISSCEPIKRAQSELFFYRKNLRKHPVATFDFRSGFLNDTVSFYLNNDTIFENQLLTSYYELQSSTKFNFIITKKKGVCYIEKRWGVFNYIKKTVDLPDKQIVVIIIVDNEVYKLPIDLNKGRHVYFCIENNRLNMWQRIVPGGID